MDEICADCCSPVIRQFAAISPQWFRWCRHVGGKDTRRTSSSAQRLASRLTGLLLCPRGFCCLRAQHAWAKLRVAIRRRRGGAGIATPKKQRSRGHGRTALSGKATRSCSDCLGGHCGNADYVHASRAGERIQHNKHRQCAEAPNPQPAATKRRVRRLRRRPTGSRDSSMARRLAA